MKKQILITGLCLSLTACGFTPIHGTAFQSDETISVQSEFAKIEISNIPDREGQYLRNELIDRFYTNGRPSQTQYTLNVTTIEESISDLDITKDSDATRAQLKLTTSIVLIDNETNQAVIERSLHAISSFNVLTSEFATRVSEKNTRQNALDDLARQIELHIALYLKKLNQTTRS